MGFLSIKGNSIYLSIDSTAKPVRPLAVEAVSKWVRSIPSCTVVGPDQKEKTLRKFTMVDADFSNWLKDNPDPLWDQLNHQDKFKQNGERQDFALRPQHILPVWSYADNDVKVIKQGNQLFEEMDRFYDTGGDVTTCDWMVWFEGNGRRKSYKTSRQNPTQFQCNVDAQTLQSKVAAVMEQALADLTPFKTEEALVTYLHGDQGTGNQIAGQQPPQQQVPGYVPGGQPGVALGAVPALPAPQAASVPGVPQGVSQGVPANLPPQTTVPQQGVLPGQMAMPGMGMPQDVPMAMPGMGMPQDVPQATVPQAMGNEAPVPNAPIATQPVFAPPPTQPQGVPQAMPQGVPQAMPTQVPTSAPQPVPQPEAAPVPEPAAGSPADVIVDSGKYKGQTLGQIAQADPKYLSYLKGQKKELAPAIEALLGNAQPTAAVPAAAPTTAVDSSSEEARGELIKAVNEKIMQIPEFQGQGVTTHMMPFIKEYIGDTNFSDAPLDKLQVLNSAIDQKLSAGA